MPQNANQERETHLRAAAFFDNELIEARRVGDEVTAKIFADGADKARGITERWRLRMLSGK